MKKLVSIIVLLIVVGVSDCGLVDSIIGTVKNTTYGVTQDVKNVWNYGKNLVLRKEIKPEETQRGLIGGWIHSSRGNLHKLRQYVWNNEDAPAQGNLVQRMYNRFKNSVTNLKEHIYVKDDPISYDEEDPEDTKLIKETLQRLFFDNGTRRVHGKAFNEAISNLRHRLLHLRNVTEATNKNETTSLEDVDVKEGESFTYIMDSEDVYKKGVNKVSAVNKKLKEVKDNAQDVIASLDDADDDSDDIYEKSVNKVRVVTKKLNDVKDDDDDFDDVYEKGVNKVKAVNKKLNDLKDNDDDSDDVFEKGVNKVSSVSKKLNDVKDSAKEVIVSLDDSQT